MTKLASLRWIAVTLVAGVTVACSAGTASVAPSRSAAPTPVDSPTPVPTPVASQTSVPMRVAASPTTAVSQVDAPAVLQVTCDGTHTTIALPIVRAERDGVHLQFDDTSGSDLVYSIENVGGDAVPVAGAAVTFPFAPGRYQVTCATDLVAFEVVDPAGFYKPAACADPGSGTTGAIDHAQGAKGLRGTPLEVAHERLRGLAPGDVVELGGYPSAPAAIASPAVVVIRGGVVQAILTLASDGAGGWLESTMRTCEGATVTLAS